MVPTRNNKIKFADGEKVLCYEPDPLMAKVLYESKILECFQKRDSRGKKLTEYKIHFNGWNSSWDRYVPEEYILPDTEENRILQKRLFAEATTRINKSNFKRKNNSDRYAKGKCKKKKNEETCNNKNDSETDENSESESDSNSSSSYDSDEKSQFEDEVEQVEIEIPSRLKNVLNMDCYLIKNEKKLIRLPSKPNVVSILESFVKNLAVNLLCPGETQQQISAEDIDTKITLYKQVVEGLRTYFDFMLPSLLLYNEERAQFKKITDLYCEKFAAANEMKIKSEIKVEKESIKTGDQQTEEIEDDKVSNADKKCNKENEMSSRRSPKGRQSRKTNTVVRKRQRSQGKADDDELKSNGIVSRRRLRSSSTQESSEVMDNIVHSKSKKKTIGRPCKNSMKSKTDSEITVLESKVDSNDVEGSTSDASRCNNSQNCSSEIKHVANSMDCVKSEEVVQSQTDYNQQKLNNILDWRLISEDEVWKYPTMPSAIYGTIHLLRMFVNLPELLRKMDIKQLKMNVIVQCISEFLQYLIEKKCELLSIKNYVTASPGQLIEQSIQID